MPTFRIWYIGTDDFAIEEARSELEACRKTGRNAEECEVQRIPEEDIAWETHTDSQPNAISWS
jgi:hypothetical protein